MITGILKKRSNIKTHYSLCFLPLIFFTFFNHNLPLQKEKKENFIRLEGAKFDVGDTIKAQFASEKFEMLHSNFGGCGHGVLYYLEFQGDSTKNVSNTIFCDYLLTEYWYESQGTLEFMVYNPGNYRLCLWSRKKGKKIKSELERFKNEHKSEWFVVE